MRRALLALGWGMMATHWTAASPAAVAQSGTGAPSAGAPTTFCNPINVDYAYCPIERFTTRGKHRATADPAVVEFRGDYYLFSTNQAGYWWSADLAQWQFVPRRFLRPGQAGDDLCAPAVLAMDDALSVGGSTYTKDFPIWRSTNPRAGGWTEATAAFEVGAWDPAFFLDDDGRLYLYHGSSNERPLWGCEIDPRTWRQVGPMRELLRLSDDEEGWQRFGEANDNTWLRPFVEGAWMTKHDGRYYLQYGAPGTEFSGYADGAAVGDGPLGPFEPQAHNPVSYRPGGFARGAGHGITFADRWGRWWHASTVVISVKNNFERRVGIWPAGFDADGVMYCDTAYGDYPRAVPGPAAEHGPPEAPPQWMLLNYAKPVAVSSALPGHGANQAVDENIKTYWSAATGAAGEWIVSDLGAECTVHAVQINYADHDAELVGRHEGLRHRYLLQTSLDGREWTTVVDKSDNDSDVPHDYVELSAPTRARYLRVENIEVPTGTFALCGLRAFGRGDGPPPRGVEHFEALRGPSEPRNAWLRWADVPEATGYVIYAGVDPEKLYTSVMVYGACDWYFRAMHRDRAYYFQIEAFNENGVGPRSATVTAKAK